MKSAKQPILLYATLYATLRSVGQLHLLIKRIIRASAPAHLTTSLPLPTRTRLRLMCNQPSLNDQLPRNSGPLEIDEKIVMTLA